MDEGLPVRVIRAANTKAHFLQNKATSTQVFIVSQAHGKVSVKMALKSAN